VHEVKDQHLQLDLVIVTARLHMWTCGQFGSEAASFVRGRRVLIRFFAIYFTSLSFAHR
jgi:hypothetical protein